MTADRSASPRSPATLGAGASADSPKVDFDEIVHNAPVAMLVKDVDGRYLYVNRQFELVMGISSKEAVGHTDLEIFPPDVAAVYREHRLRALEEMSPQRFEEPLLVQGRERCFSTVTFPVLGEKEVLRVCGISMDITEAAGTDPAVTEQQSRADAFFGRLLASLTPQEVRVLDLVVSGLSDREIAEKLSLSSDTVRHHVSHLLKKLRRRRTPVIIEMLKRRRA